MQEEQTFDLDDVTDDDPMDSLETEQDDDELDDLQVKMEDDLGGDVFADEPFTKATQVDEP
jgi:hypothetical protein